ncbi:pyridoxamine 5'-phosphate oxidase family protein [Paucibacter sediminis]|uniref:Pyridoxamine 5'-phosphate oxidase family protein n=1 Tax=Paucibacter sediminis TaxID=3019553 RepID=A0AA95NGD5_9BURK|nr:pyridoxamine 5'-phosphate oxidase family protein [Paucibacter sp. S2-9]WIT13765.1 pyridoxamine 5'-phosphate oxidase family protein [Paucibacter sp. S2-9]
MSDSTAPWQDRSHDVRDVDALRGLYGWPGETSTSKESDHIHPLYRPYIEAAPFAVLATRGPHGLDTSPRGDRPGFVQVADAHTLLLPDRRGNNRIDSLRNVLHDPAVALLFLIPGVGEALRVNGLARISSAPTLLQRFEVDGKLPRSVLVIEVKLVFFQCARAIKRSGLWDATVQIDRSRLPSPGLILQTLSGSIDGQAYDAALQERQQQTLY